MLQATIARLESEVAELTRSSATGAATLGDQLTEQQGRWAAERRQVREQNVTPKSSSKQRLQRRLLEWPAVFRMLRRWATSARSSGGALGGGAAPGPCGISKGHSWRWRRKT